MLDHLGPAPCWPPLGGPRASSHSPAGAPSSRCSLSHAALSIAVTLLLQPETLHPEHRVPVAAVGALAGRADAHHRSGVHGADLCRRLRHGQFLRVSRLGLLRLHRPLRPHAPPASAWPSPSMRRGSSQPRNWRRTWAKKYGADRVVTRAVTGFLLTHACAAGNWS